MIIAPAATTDLPAIDTLTVRSITQTVDAPDAQKHAFLQHIRANLNTWSSQTLGALHLKACDSQGSLVGVVMVKDYWNLCHLFVDPDYQRSGVGRSLLEAAIVECRERSPRRYLRLNASRNATGFYERMGFQLVPDAPAPYTGTQYQLDL